MIVAVAAAGLLGAYDCQLDAPRAITLYDTGDVAAASEIGLPQMARRFTVEIRDGNPLMVEVRWAGDPMQVSGEFPAIRTAPGAYAFSAFSSGPCLFTEGPCITQVNIVETGNRAADVLVMPAAVAKRSDRGNVRFALPVIAKGLCKRTDRTA